MQVTSIINKITNASGAAKAIVLAQHAENYVLLDVLKYTYEPTWSYGIKKFPWVARGTETIESTHDIWKSILEQLRDRIITGDHAKAVVGQYVANLTVQDAVVFKHMLTKDLRAGIGITTINKVIKDLVGTFKFMKAQAYKTGMIKETGPLYMSVKIDCIRGLLRNGTIYSTGGKVITGVQHLTEGLPSSLELDGELTIPGKDFNSASGLLRSKHDCPTVVFNIFDVPSSGQRFDARLQYMEYLKETLFQGRENIKVIKHSLATKEETIMYQFGRVLSAGYEGLVCKTPDHFYQLERSKDWLKVKAEDPEDGIIVGFNRGTGKNADTFSTISVQRPNGVIVKVGGLKESMMAYIKKNEDKLIGKCISYKYHEETPDGSLRHPRFFRERWDKDSL